MSDAHAQLSLARDVQGSGWSADLNMNNKFDPISASCLVEEVRIGRISQSTLKVSEEISSMSAADAAISP
jgi:hypothetical protein